MRASYLTGATRRGSRHLFLLALPAVLIMLSGASGAAASTYPSVSLGTPQRIDATSETLNGSVNPNGQQTTYQFRYDTTDASCLSLASGAPATPADAGSGTSAVPVSAPLTNLTTGVTYYYCLRANWTSAGSSTTVQSFVAGALPAPSASVGAATGVGPHAATLHGVVNPNGQATSYHFEYGCKLYCAVGESMTPYGRSTPSVDAGLGTSDQAVSATLAGLTMGAVYQYRVVATNNSGTTDGYGFMGAPGQFQTGATLTVRINNVSGASGSVSSTNLDIGCPSHCTVVYHLPAVLVLKAAPKAGSFFAGWSGGGCSLAGSCTVRMTADRTVTATFKKGSLRPPDTAITRATISSRQRQASFAFAAVGPAAGFQCALVRKPKPPRMAPKPTFAACGSPKTYKQLVALGTYTFFVRAFNAAGPDPAPATRIFTIS